MASQAMSSQPLIGCLAEAESLAGGLIVPWQSSNRRSQTFIEQVIPDLAEIQHIPEMQSKAARDVITINNWLKERGFSIRLSGPGDLFLASLMDLLVKWLESGQTEELNGYRGVRVNDQTARVIYQGSWPRDRYAVEVYTQGPDVAYMYIPDQPPTDAYETMMAIAEIDNQLHGPGAQLEVSKRYAGVVFPEVQLDTRPDISWLEQLSAVGQDGHPLVVDQCLQQVKLRLDPEGARVQTAAAMAVSRSIGPILYRVNHPFLFWIRRPGVTNPILFAYLDQDCWVH